MKPVVFPDDPQFWYETQRVLGHTAFGGADTGEVLATALRLWPGSLQNAADQVAEPPGQVCSAGVACSRFERVAPAEARMRMGSVLLIIWLLIGAIAAGQRGYYSGSIGNCTKVGTIAVTILAGPLNYLGVNPTISCTAPQPSS